MKAALITAALSLALLGATDAQARSHQPHPAKTQAAAPKPAKKAVHKKHAKKHARKAGHKKAN